MERDDSVRVSALKKGSHLAFTELFAKYNVPLYYLAWHFLSDKEQARDAVQQVYLKLWETKEHLNESLNFKSYLFVMMKNHLLNQLRDIQKTSLTDIAEADGLKSELNIADEIETQELSAELLSAIERLSPQKKRICKLKVYEGKTNTEIAGLLNISVNTVKVQYNQIIKELRAHVTESVSLYLLFLTYLADACL